MAAGVTTGDTGPVRVTFEMFDFDGVPVTIGIDYHMVTITVAGAQARLDLAVQDIFACQFFRARAAAEDQTP